ncbi:MAG: family 1 glycosylhydrolase, partial [Phycisphaeraceae bacterium]|nr:family 1 glycosylhydrolase [Phycisphaeraceae bacterium]
MLIFAPPGRSSPRVPDPCPQRASNPLVTPRINWNTRSMTFPENFLWGAAAAAYQIEGAA